MTRINITYLKALACAASTEEARFYLRGVLVECAPRAVTYAATDGHVLLAAHDALGDDDESNAVLGHFIIPAEAIAKMKPASRAARVTMFDTLSQGPNGTLILCSQVFEPIDGTFPDWRRVLPKGGETWDKDYPQYDPPVVMRLHKAAEIVNGRKTTQLIRICPAASGYPAAVEMPFGDLPWFGVVMPIRRSEDPWQRPEWLSSSMTTPAAEPVAQAAE